MEIAQVKHEWAEHNPLEKTLNNILNKCTDINSVENTEDLKIILEFLSSIDKSSHRLVRYACMHIVQRALIDISFLKNYSVMCHKLNQHDHFTFVLEWLFINNRKMSNNFVLFLGYVTNEGILTNSILEYILNDFKNKEMYEEMCVLIGVTRNTIHIPFLQGLKGISNKLRFKIMDLTELKE
jgi:hypothetical protein